MAYWERHDASPCRCFCPKAVGLQHSTTPEDFTALAQHPINYQPMGANDLERDRKPIMTEEIYNKEA
ncbi:uncharacterized protein N7498_008729 [Penicillium cinerascens]|uniref:Uncharacterized protein n=1 Tax=Penicillium cinerascens TaxID=70096 RepID=A0A9W9JFX5_9EURO|nr:uncharacterized protein N7498_008729 [Penicillium cinerascens]KAJ5195291.1 hypothetical protein N7498_008729 [Penicillium cinerascens]